MPADPEVHELVAPEDAGRVDAWVARATGLSRSAVQALVRAGRVTVEGHPVRPSYRLSAGERVRVEVPHPEPARLPAQDLGVPLLHVDDHVVVVDKPAGMPSHPSRGHPDGTLVNAVLHLLRVPLDEPPAGVDWLDDPPRPGLVHRLDLGTSGVMVVARTPMAHAALSAQFAAHTTEREYLALAWGHAAADAGVVDAPHGRDPRHRKRFAVVPGGRRARTHWRVLGRAVAPGVSPFGGRVTLFACRLETGRTHQVRVHLRHLGHPLVGDALYGPGDGGWPEALGGPVVHPLLHARLLAFDHPGTGERVRFTAPPRPEMRRVLDALGLDWPRD